MESGSSSPLPEVTSPSASASPPAAPSSPNTTLPEEQICPLCNEKISQPRILSCLHVFCTKCLEKQQEDEEEDAGEELEPETNESDGDAKGKDVITCAQCQQKTQLTEKGVNDLPQDSILTSMLESTSLDDMQIVCTSCKAREKAVARCQDCANFLCPNCVTAHQYMRCFENHKVVSFEDLQNGEGLALHKPVFCPTHTSETMKFFCCTCDEPQCNECVIVEHKPPEHVVERIADIEGRQVEELQKLVAESKSKVEYCREVEKTLDNQQQELQMQRDNARGLIEETFHTYKAMLEKQREKLLSELSEKHGTHRNAIWDLSHDVNKTIERVEDGCKFVERVLQNGSSVEILGLKKLMAGQLMSLINNTPSVDINVKLEFNTDNEEFTTAVEQYFGHLNKPKPKPVVDTAAVEESLATAIQSIEGSSFPLDPDVLSAEALSSSTPTDFIATLSALPPLSIPNIPSLTTSVSYTAADAITSLPPTSLPPLSSDRSCSSRNSYSPAMSDSGISVDAGSTGSTTQQPAPTQQQPVINLAALTKLGSVNINSTGQLTLNGQVIPGLNVNNVTGLPQSLTTRVHTPTPTSEASLASLLGSLSVNTSTATTMPPRSSTPQLQQLNDITGLLNHANQQLSSLGSASPGGSILPSPLPHLGATLPLNASPTGLGMNTPPPVTPSAFSHTSVAPPMTFSTRSGKLETMQISLQNALTNNPTKMAPMHIGCKFGQLGPGKGQFNSPHGFCLGIDEDIIVADTNNHRVQVFEKTGEFKYQFGIPGRDEGQLWYPRKVAVIRHSGKYVVCDRGSERSRMQIFTKNGHFIKKIAIRYIDIVAGLAITSHGHIVAVDSVSPTVFCIHEHGDLIKWFDCSDYMREPSDIAIDGREYFVCDFKGHCVVVFNEDGQFLRRIGCENITNFPNGIDISNAGDVLVGDSHGNRFHVAVFQRDGSLIGEFECPYVKVSRCCGLKITAEGYIVTLAKNNHHVLVLNTLFVQ